MNLLGYFALFLLTFLAVHGQNDVPTTVPEQNTVTDQSTSTSSDQSSTTVPVTTSTPTGTTEQSTSQSTEPPVTATSTEQTTTPGSGSSSASPTEEPTNTPTPPSPTSTVAPSQDLNLYVNNSGKFCILMDMEITLTVQYENATGVNVTNSYVVRDGDINVDEKNSSDCNDSDKANDEQLVATFKGTKNELYVQFNRSDNKVSINLFKLTFTDINSIFPDARSNQSMTLLTNKKLFEYSSAKSYKCDAENKVDLVDENGSGTNSYVTFKDVKVQAFGTGSGANFVTAEDCVQDDNVSDIVPIAVGCALAALVVIVLIAYLIGRRQKRQRGYESV